MSERRLGGIGGVLGTAAVGTPATVLATQSSAVLGGLVCAVALGVLYRSLVNLLGSVHLQVTEDDVSVWRSPLPWRSTRVDLRGCHTARVVRTVHQNRRWGNETITYSLAVDRKEGAPLVVECGNVTPAEAEYLRGLIQAYVARR